MRPVSGPSMQQGGLIFRMSVAGAPGSPKDYCILGFPGKSVTVSPRLKLKACSPMAEWATVMIPNSSPDHTTIYFTQAREKSQSSLTGLAHEDI